ncbi:MAG: Spx/MgsR family RNA polymerase-binding regulatory protein [Algisphaera sp.]
MNNDLNAVFYGYGTCDSCRKARKWLDAAGVGYTVVDIATQPPGVEVLEAALEAGFALGKLFNRSGRRYRELDMKTRLPKMSEAEALELLAGDGMLVKRPIVFKAGVSQPEVTVGFDPDVYGAVWGAGR